MASPCKHLRKHKPDLVKVYKSLCERLVYPATFSDLSHKASFWCCLVCKSKDNPLLCCCLECIYFACLDNQHLKQHFDEKGHKFALSLETGHIYCSECNDFIYDRDCEYARRDAENAHRKLMGFSLNYTWNPGKQEVDQIKQARKRVIRMSSKTTYGLRGLVNLGNTCFMSCILQALTHTPLLRDYFMTDQHRCIPKGVDQCLMCEMAHLFQEFYSGKNTPHIPFKMLHLVWTHARHLAGYEQQDAHEFFIAALDVLHRHSRSSAMARNPQECQCIIDRIFTGKLQSDVTCMSCGGVSTTLDPYWDISLDLGTQTAATGFSDALLCPVDQAVAPASLADCLERFTRPENLGSSAKIKCGRCDTYEESTKQLTLRMLPIVACFHLKRFEHSSKLHKKINDFISFPQYLDMTPYTAIYRDHSAAPEAHQAALLSSRQSLDRIKNKYALFAVVNHHGTIEGGHYTCYIRQHVDDWYKCDDHIISRASLDDVLASQGYLLFYHKQFLDYD